MSFIQAILSLFSLNKITIIAVPYYNQNNNNNNLKYTFNSGITVGQIMDNMNKYIQSVKTS